VKGLNGELGKGIEVKEAKDLGRNSAGSDGSNLG
jgi:hypothetical protein